MISSAPRKVVMTRRAMPAVSAEVAYRPTSWSIQTPTRSRAIAVARKLRKAAKTQSGSRSPVKRLTKNDATSATMSSIHEISVGTGLG